MFFLLTIISYAQEISTESEPDIEELRQRITGEAAQEIMSFSLGDADVSLFMAGSWMGTLQGNAGLSLSPLGTSFYSPETPILFKQETDLTMSLWITDRWFIEANFLDESSKNTYRAGYQGLPGEFIQYAGIGNTGLDFPAFPYLDLGGSSPSSFGFYGRTESSVFESSAFAGGKLSLHTLVRYDASSREEKIFYGSRERTYSFIPLNNFIRGVSFVLPDININSDVIVYLEDEKGPLYSSDGRRWRMAQPSEYAAGRVQGLLELSVKPAGMVAVSYSKNADTKPWNTSLGSYQSGTGFLGEVQSRFGDLIDLDNYPQCIKEIEITGVNALVIREPGTFSPFERLNRYEAPSSTSEEVSLVTLSTGVTEAGYELIKREDQYASDGFFSGIASGRGVYELYPADASSSQRSVESRWPLAALYPEIYLPASGVFTGDLILRFTNYGSGGFFIGTDAVSGSIQVWRNGIQDTNFIFNESTGEISMNGHVGANEVIRVTYLRQSDEARLGSIAAGIGAVYQKRSGTFSALTALGLRWNLTERSSFTDEDFSSSGTVGLSAKAAWDYDYLKAHVSAAFALDQSDTTGLYRAAGMEGNEIILSLTDDSFISNPPASEIVTGLLLANRADLVYRNYVNTGITGSTLMSASWSEASVVSSLTGPYPVKDPQLDERSLAAEFTLDSIHNWTGFQTPLYFDSEFLSRASEIEIPYRFFDFNRNPANFRFIIQIGSLSPEGYPYSENTALIWEQSIFPGYSGEFSGDLKIARFILTDSDRLRLGDANYLRVIAVYEGMGDEISGRIILSPPIVRGSAFRAVTYDGNSVSGAGEFLSSMNRVTVTETTDFNSSSLESSYGSMIKRLHPVSGTQRVLKMDWQDMQPGISAGIDGRIGTVPLGEYRELSFFVKGPSPVVGNGTLSFIIAGGSIAPNDRILEAHIPLNAFEENKWSKVTIRYQGGSTGIEVDGREAQDAWFRYRPQGRLAYNPAQKNEYIAVLVNPEDSASSLDDSGICIDEIILEDSNLVYRVTGGTAVEYNRPGEILSIRGIPFFGDFRIGNTLESEVRMDPVAVETGADAGVINRTGMGFSIFGFNLTGNFLFTAREDEFLWSADHGISRAFGPFSASENFFASPLDNTASHNVDFNLSAFRIASVEIPVFASFKGDVTAESQRQDRIWNASFGFRHHNVFIPSFSAGMNASWRQNNFNIEGKNYGGLWVSTAEDLIPDTGRGADTRKTQTDISITEAAKPIGAILAFSGITNYTKANFTVSPEYRVNLDVPLYINNFNFVFSLNRGFRKQLDFSSEDRNRDTSALFEGEKFFESISDSLPLWGVFPWYSLFTAELNSAMDKAIENSPSKDAAQYTAFNDSFGTRMNFPSIYNLASFFVPSSAGLSLERVLERKLDTKTDALNLGGSLGFSSINMLGAMGYRPVFNFYQNDEFNNMIETAIIIPKNENISWRLQLSSLASFRGFNGGVLNFRNTLTFRDEREAGNSWLESLLIDWTFPVTDSLIGIFYDWAASAISTQSSWLALSSLLNSGHEKLYKESLEIVLESTEENFKFSLVLGHEAIVRILGRLNFSAFTKLRFGSDRISEIFTFDVILGTSLRIIF